MWKNNSPYLIPLILLGVCLAAFGLLIPFLGFHWDDWMTLFLAETQESFRGYWYSAARPLHAILDEITYPVLGTNPAAWQLLSLGIRWLTAVLVWRLLRRLWPDRGEFALAVAVLFAIYPSFFQQSSAVIYRHHWSSYALYLASVLFMLRRGKTRWQRGLNLGLGLLCMAAGLFTTEYMFGLEALRPVFLWIVLKEEAPGAVERRRRVLSAWWPYLLLGLAFFGWRSFLIDRTFSPNMPIVVFDLFSQPLPTLLDLVQTGLRDLVQLYWLSWSRLLRPDLVDLYDAAEMLAWVAGVGVALGLGWLLPRLFPEAASSEHQQEWGKVLGLGLLATVAGLSTAWVIGRHVTEGGFSDRFSIPAMLGASLVLVSLLFAAIPRPNQRRLVLVFLVGLAVAAHIRSANRYRHDWELQSRFAWQVVQRAPALEPGTAFVSDEAVTVYLARYNAAFALNLIYGQAHGTYLPYWYEELFTGLHHQIDEFESDLPIEFTEWGLDFSGSTQQALVLSPEPGDSLCLWLLGPTDEENFTVGEELRLIAPYSNLQTIHAEDQGAAEAVERIFGPEPDPYWCTYFQQASLAYQQGEWDQILDLWADVQAADLNAYDGHEYLPFIEAMAWAGRWQAAAELSIRAYQVTPAAEAMLCAAWQRIRAVDPDNEQLLAARLSTREVYSCVED